MSFDYQPVIFKLKQIKTWWLLPVFMLAGALIGLLVGFFLPPTYEATFTVTTNFEINMTDEITELMLDGAINHVGELVFNPEVVNDLIEAETSKGNPLTLEQLRKITSVERRLTSTFIKVKWQDPKIAARIANTWGEIFFDHLQKAYKQAVVAEGLTAYQETLETCLLQSDGSSAMDPCYGLDRDELQQDIKNVSLEIADARGKSLGLHPLLYVSQFTPAEIPSKPLYYSKNSLVLAGAMVGLVIALIILEVKYGDGVKEL